MAVRSGNWKAVKLNADTPSKAILELFDLSSDRGESSNVAAAHPEIARQMEEIMRQSHLPSVSFPFSFEKSDPTPEQAIRTENE